MQVVFHIEPGREFRHVWFLRAAALAGRLAAAGGFQVRIVIGADHAGAAADLATGAGLSPDVRLLDTSLLTGTLGLPADELAHRHGFPAPGDPVVAWLAGALRALLGDAPPDLLITATPAGAYHAAFGRLPTLFMETGPFARPPFPDSLYLDPAGPACLDILDAVPDAPDRLDLPPAAEAALAAVQAAARQHVLDHSPYAALVAGLRQRFRRLVLLPLHGEAGPVFRRGTPIRGQAELAWAVARALPADTAVLALPHPSAGAPPDLPEGLLPNLVVLPRLHWSIGGADYLAPLVDGVVVVDSKAAFAGLLHGVPVLALAEGRYRAFAAGPALLAGGAFLGQPAGTPAHRRLLAWLLTCFAPPAELACGTDWAPELCRRFLAGGGTAAAGLPAPFGPPAEVLGALAQAIRRHPPPLTAGAPLAETPALAAAWPARALPLPVPAQMAGGALAAEQTAPAPTPGQAGLLLLEEGWAEFPPPPPDLIGFEAEITVQRAAADWVPLVWAGDPAAPWQRGRSLCLALLAPQGQLQLVAGGPAMPQRICWSRPGVLPIGRPCRVAAAVLPGLGRFGIVVDGVVVGLEPFAEGPPWPPAVLLLGQDGHFRGPGTWVRYRAPRLLLSPAPAALAPASP